MQNNPPQLTGAEILWATLVGEGVTTVFGYPGGAILPIYDALRKFPIHHVLVRHEQGASHMADGYARASGRTGVCMATSGPGATNLVTGIATAMLDSIPMVAITGQVSSKVLGSDAFQEVDITGITLPITKHNFLVTRAEDIAPAVRLAFQIAASGRPGPVHVDITKDAQQGTAPFSFEDAAPPAARPHPMVKAPLPDAIEQALSLIRAAKKPVILAGHGITQSGAEAEVLAFAERLQIPIASTLLGLGAIPAAHPLSLGMMGMHGESWVNHAIQQSDLLLAFGMRFDDRVTGNLASYAPNAKKIHIEIDPSEISKNVKADVALIGDLKSILTQLNQEFGAPGLASETWDRIATKPSSPWLQRNQPVQRQRRGPRHCQPARQRSPLRRARHQRYLAGSRSRRPRARDHHRHRRRPAPDVGSAILQARSPALARHLRWPRHHGFRPARRHRRQGRLPRTRTCGSSPATAASR